MLHLRNLCKFYDKIVLFMIILSGVFSSQAREMFALKAAPGLTV